MAAYERQEEERKARARTKGKNPTEAPNANPWGATARPSSGLAYWGADDYRECGLEGAVAACLAADCLVSFGLTRSKRALRVTVLKGSHKGVAYLQEGEPDTNTAEVQQIIAWAEALHDYDANAARRWLGQDEQDD